MRTRFWRDSLPALQKNAVLYILDWNKILFDHALLLDLLVTSYTWTCLDSVGASVTVSQVVRLPLDLTSPSLLRSVWTGVGTRRTAIRALLAMLRYHGRRSHV